MSRQWVAPLMILVLAFSVPLWAQRGGGRGGAAGRGAQQGTMGQQRSPMAERSGLSAQDRQRIRGSDRQRIQYRSLAQAVNRVRTRARELRRLARGAGGGYELLRAQYVELQNELEAIRDQHDNFTDSLSEEQQAATADQEKEMAKDLDELNVWMEAMDEELNQSEPDAKKLDKQARGIEKAAKDWQDDSRRLAEDLSIE